MMAHAKTKATTESGCAGSARRHAGAPLLLAIAILLSACGTEVEYPGAGGGAGAGAGTGTGSGATTCVTSAGDPVLTWDPVDAVAFPGLAGYRIYYGTSSGTYLQAPGNGIDVGNVTTFTVTGLTPGTTYYFVATAYDATDESVFSNEACKAVT
jgi:hypothetical protein